MNVHHAITEISGPTITEQLTDFIMDCEYSTVPDEVIQRFRMFILDYLGVALTGSYSRSSEIIAQVVEELGGKETATVVGRSYKANAALGALVNGTTGHAVEMDDDHRTSVLHPAVAVVPAAMAAAELVGAKGDKLIEGVICGYELMCRIGDAFLGTMYDEGFHPTGACGVFGAAAAAGKILGLDRDQMVAALGIAGTQAAGLEEWKTDGSWIKRLHPGKSAEAGILSVLLAKNGYTGPSTIIEGVHGFLKAFSFERKWDVNMILDGLGTEYRGYGTSFKPYAGCRFYHQVIDATLALTSEHKIDAASVKDAKVRVYRTAYQTLCTPKSRRYRPTSVVDAQFSIPFSVAASIIHGPVMPVHYSEEAIHDPAVLDLCARVEGIPDDEYEKGYPARFPTEVTINTYDGRSVTAYRDLPSGDPENPIYEEKGRFEREIVEKFRALLGYLPDYADRTDTMVSRLSALGPQDDVTELLSLFTPAGRA
ncbi:MmgE/PrpD family protein [Acuticoccus mangrovi]|uniref:MmgE/PrpD family protein n=1 Tax=Acuticoccus mangrovi TaxID=2796142 RepID=A0A934IR28_9HYPH|nr:MmgE/PrpD family protein [Acuticoccus mangrovi]MBJ3777110.1 MmgE/PrpD family protein [Acuticoccus mangrovi]